MKHVPLFMESFPLSHVGEARVKAGGIVWDILGWG